MGVFEMVTIISIAGIAAGIYDSHLKTKRKQMEFEGLDSHGEIAELTKRVEALEKIVTDKQYQLREEFNKL